MNIQIFGKSKCFDTQKTLRYFKERGIRFQQIDLLKYGMSKGEYESVRKAVGGFRALMDEEGKEYNTLGLKYFSPESAVEEKLLENPKLFKTPIVRNGRQATVGYCPEVWKTWE